MIMITKQGCSACDMWRTRHVPEVIRYLSGTINITNIEISDTKICPRFLDEYVKMFPTLLMCTWSEFQAFFNPDGSLKPNTANRRFKCRVFDIDDYGNVMYESIAQVQNPVQVCINWALRTDKKLKAQTTNSAPASRQQY